MLGTNPPPPIWTFFQVYDSAAEAAPPAATWPARPARTMIAAASAAVNAPTGFLRIAELLSRQRFREGGHPDCRSRTTLTPACRDRQRFDSPFDGLSRIAGSTSGN